jgi:hypothetical protein
MMAQPVNEGKVIQQQLDVISSDNATVAEVVLASTQLEDLVHQVDNGADFAVSMGGVKVVLDTMRRVRDEAVGRGAAHEAEALRVISHLAWVLGTANQNNPVVQLKTMEQKGGTYLLQETQRVHALIHTHHMSSEQAVQTQGKLVYALGSVLRGCVDHQLAFLREGGLEAFRVMLDDTSAAIGQRAHDKESTRVAVKMMSVVEDLLEELILHPRTTPAASAHVQFIKLREDGATALGGEGDKGGEEGEKKEGAEEDGMELLRAGFEGTGWGSTLSRLAEQAAPHTTLRERVREVHSGIRAARKRKQLDETPPKQHAEL